MWQQALLDIARTCYLAPKEPTYFAEWASLDLRVKRIDEGISAAKQRLSRRHRSWATPVPKNISSNNFIGFHAPVNEIKLSDKHLADSNNSK